MCQVNHFVYVISGRTHAVMADGKEMDLGPGDVATIPANHDGWVVDRPRVRLPNGTEVQLRVTTIFHREGGMWKGVHQHASIGVPNDQVEAFRGT